MHVKKSTFFYITLNILLFSTNSSFAGRCTGSSNCKACTTCSSCRYCNSGGSCGVCSGSGDLGNLFLYGGGILLVLWLFSDSSKKK